ncbi:MAG: peptide ABC transporter substrate-binding protein [Thermomicrobiales bacterium]
MTNEQDLVARLARGEVSRRNFIRRAAALGISASAIAGFLAACGGSSPTATAATSATTSSAAATSKASSSTTASSSAATTSAATTSAATTSAASSTTASASAAAAASPTRASGAATPGTPAAGVGAAAIGAPSTAKPGAAGGIGPGPTKRGAAGTLKVLYWQAATTLNPHFASGAKDQDAARLVLEPLAEFGPNDTLIPWLAAGIPTIANGGIAKDGKSVTWKLKPGIKWSDGQPFTAQDCVFTWQFASTKETGATTIGNYLAVDKVEALDETTVKVSFTAPNPAWYLPLTDAILPEHIFKDAIGKEAKNFAGNLKPIGTGPYKVDDFKPGDSVAYSVNPNWRDPNGPAFDQVQWKGGGDATSAARAVLQTGDYHLAWNLQVEPAIFNQLVKQAGDRAKIGYQPGSGVERVVFNFTDPNKTDPDTGERSSVKFPHPFLTDKTVRQALNLVADRKAIADTLYGPAGEPWALIQNAPESALPQDVTWAFDLDKAGQVLDQAGWKKNGQYRAKDGVQMKLLFQTTTNSVRQKTQQILKDALEKLGIQTELKSIDAGVFFSTDPGSPDTSKKFYADWEMYGGAAGSPDAQRFLNFYTTAQIPQKANNWAFSNDSRYANPAYDKLAEQARTELDPVKRTALLKAEYQLLYDDAAALPLISRKQAYAYASGLQGFEGNPWGALTWNIANWTKG